MPTIGGLSTGTISREDVISCGFLFLDIKYSVSILCIKWKLSMHVFIHLLSTFDEFSELLFLIIAIFIPELFYSLLLSFELLKVLF